MKSYHARKVLFLIPVLVRHFFLQPGLLISLAGILAGTCFLAMSSLGQPAAIRFAVCTDGSTFAEAVYEQLVKTDSVIQFYRCEDREELHHDVMSGQAECGYLLDRQIEEELVSGDLEDIIETASNPGTIVKGMADELVFTAVLSVYSPELYARYLSETLITDDAGRREIAREAFLEYQNYRTNGSTFQFQFSNGRSTVENSLSGGQIPFLRLRGITAVMILAGALCAAASYQKDRSSHRFLWAGNELLPELASYMIAIFIFCMTGLAGLSLTAEWRGLFSELHAMSVYALSLLAFCFLTSHILKSEAWVIAFLPFAAAGSLVLAPVFVDLSQFSRLAGLLKWATPVSLYLSLI